MLVSFSGNGRRWGTGDRKKEKKLSWSSRCRQSFRLSQHFPVVQVMAAKEAIMAISVEATQEGTLEDALERVSLRWTSIDLPIVAYKDNKDVFVLGSLDDLTAPLDDSLVTISTILSSRCFPVNVLYHAKYFLRYALLTASWIQL